MLTRLHIAQKVVKNGQLSKTVRRMLHQQNILSPCIYVRGGSMEPACRRGARKNLASHPSGYGFFVQSVARCTKLRYRVEWKGSRPLNSTIVLLEQAINKLLYERRLAALSAVSDVKTAKRQLKDNSESLVKENKFLFREEFQQALKTASKAQESGEKLFESKKKTSGYRTFPSRSPNNSGSSMSRQQYGGASKQSCGGVFSGKRGKKFSKFITIQSVFKSCPPQNWKTCFRRGLDQGRRKTEILCLELKNPVIGSNNFGNYQGLKSSLGWQIKDACWHIPSHPSSRKFLRFQWRTKLYEMLVLVFGVGPGLRIFTKLMKVPITVLRRMLILIIVYLGDLLVIESIREEALMSSAKLERVGTFTNSIREKISQHWGRPKLDCFVASIEKTAKLHLMEPRTRERVDKCVVPGLGWGAGAATCISSLLSAFWEEFWKNYKNKIFSNHQDQTNPLIHEGNLCLAAFLVSSNNIKINA